MEEFLKKINLDENSIKLYKKALNKGALTYFELRLILSELDDEQFSSILNNLLNLNLIINIESQKKELLTHYVAIPPYSPILTYYENIETSFSQIQEAIENLIIKTVNDVFDKDNQIELQSLDNEYKEIRKDFEEDSLLQKKDADDIVKHMNNIKKLENILENLQLNIKGIAKAQFGTIIRSISDLRKKLTKKIEELEIKKYTEIVIKSIEDVFLAELDTMVEGFINKINALIEEEFKKAAYKPIIEKTVQNTNDFKMLLLNLLSTFEIKMNRISDIIEKKSSQLNPNITQLKENIIDRINVILNNSLDQINDLNDPIRQLFSDYNETLINYGEDLIDEIWEINTITKINEYIMLAIQNSQDELLIIAPKLEDYLSLDLFNDMPDLMSIKIVTSDPHVNSKVKKFKEINNLKFRSFQNEHLIAVRCDDTLLAVGLIRKDLADSLNNFIGIGTNHPELINYLKKSVYHIWSEADPGYSDEIEKPPIQEETTKTQELVSERVSVIEERAEKNKTKISKQLPVSSEESQLEVKAESNKPKISENIKKELEISISKEKDKEKSVDTEAPILSQAKEVKSEEELKSPANTKYVSKVQPRPANQAGLIINNAFDELLSKLGNLNGEEFAEELESVADIVLEKRGFSVTLHDIRRTINDYKKNRNPLSEQDTDAIFEKFEDWKNRLIK